MPNAVYDDQEKDIKPKTSDDELRAITGIDGDEEKAMEQSAASGAADDILQKETGSPDIQPDPDFSREKSFYNPSDIPSQQFFVQLKNGFTGSNNKKTWFAGFGVLGIVGIIGIASLFSFLNTFKLDHFMQNIEQKTMVRYMSATDNRSSKWIEAYVKIRLTSLNGDGSDSPLFRSDRVDNNNPMTDWYRTMRASNFEKDLALKGVTFTNFTEDGPDGIRRGFAVLKVDGRVVAAGLADQTVPNGASNLNRYIESNGGLIDVADSFDLDKPGQNRAARQAIKKIVNENTHSWQVIKRRHVRKSIQNMTGIKSWRFFETTRDKYDAKKQAIMKKIVTSMVPESTKSGKLIGCLMGFNDCRGTTDPADPNNKDATRNTGTPKDKSTDVVDDTTDDIDPNTKGDQHPNVSNEGQGILEDAVREATTEATEDVADETLNKTMNEIIATTIKESLKKVNLAVGIVSLLDTLKTINDAMDHHELTKLIYVARLTSLMGGYQTLATMADQMKTGEVTSAEVNDTMKVLNNIGNNDGWQTMSQNATTAKADSNTYTAPKNSQEYCSEEHQNFIQDTANNNLTKNDTAYLCDNDRPNGGSTAGNVEKFWNDNIEPIIKPFLVIYDGIPFLSEAVGWLNSATSWVIGQLHIGDQLGALMQVLGIKDDFEQLMGGVMAKVMEFAGAAPLITDSTPPQKIGAYVVAGGAATQSVSIRDAGGVASTKETRAESIKIATEYQENKNTNTSLFDKYFNVNNTDSLASTGAYNLASTTTGHGGAYAFTKYIGSIGSSLGGLFSHNTKAENDPYQMDAYAGVDSYDFAAQCMNLDPLTATPANSTNIIQVLGTSKVKQSELTWNLLRNGEAWSEFIYSKIDRGDANADAVAKSIYNCQALDNVVAGGLGAMYGYTNDDGLDSESAASETTSDSSSSVSPDASAQEVLDQCKNNTASGKVKIVCGTVGLNGLPYDSNQLTGDNWNNRPSKLGCNSYVNFAIARATNGAYLENYCSGGYLRKGVGEGNFKKIAKEDVQPGDLIIHDEMPAGGDGCGGTSGAGHVEIVVSYDKASDKLVTTGAHNSSSLSGVLNPNSSPVSSDYWSYGMEYIGSNL